MSSSAASAVAEPPARMAADIPVICGPTAAGKSAVAMRLAERRDVVIVSADSRQVYRGLDVGTGKPSAADLKRVPHRGVDVVEPTERYSAAAWVTMARAAIDEAHSSGRLAIVVGGTGFYISALFQPLFEEPALDPAARAAVQAGLAECSTDELRRWCAALDPERSHLGRAQLLRAIEIALLTGERLSEMHRTRARPATHSAHYLLVDPGLSLASKIEARASAMFESGWVDEVRRLIRSVPESAPAWNATGYRAVRRCAAGELSIAEALKHVVIETRQYAKRQRTWFRHQLDSNRVERLTPGAPGWEEQVERWLSRIVESRVTSHVSRSVR